MSAPAMALYEAAKSGNLERVQVLMKRGVDMNNSNKGRTPLFVASRYGHSAVVRFLVEQGADMEKAGKDDNWTPLMTASYYGHEEVVWYLLEQGANRDNCDDQGRTSLHWVVRAGNLEITKLLMVYGADLNAKTNVGYMPIDFTRNKQEIRKAILKEPQRRMDHACWFLRQQKKRRSTQQYAAETVSAQPQEDEDEGEEQDDERSTVIDEVEEEKEED